MVVDGLHGLLRWALINHFILGRKDAQLGVRGSDHLLSFHVVELWMLFGLSQGEILVLTADRTEDALLKAIDIIRLLTLPLVNLICHLLSEGRANLSTATVFLGLNHSCWVTAGKLERLRDLA